MTKVAMVPNERSCIMARKDEWKKLKEGVSFIVRPEDFVNQSMYQELQDMLGVSFGSDVKDETNILISHYKAYPQD